MSDELTHLDDRGEVRMVDVGGKPIVRREAVAEGWFVAASSGNKNQSGSFVGVRSRRNSSTGKPG